MFNGIWLVAAEPLTVQGREVQAGERFQVSRIHSGALLVMGRATIAPKVPPEPIPEPPRRRARARKIQTTDIAAETPESAETDEVSKRQYRRRDLEAEP